jgi:hypothetical protein
MSERRCAACGALVTTDAEWCGQCYAPLGEPTSPATASPAAVLPRTSTSAASSRFARAEDGAGAPTAWRCPTCEAENDLGVNACRLCGRPFGSLFDDPAIAPPHVAPASAAAWSLLMPGLGHWIAGRRADAVARFALAAWIGGMLVLLVASRGADGFGSVGPLVLLFGMAAAALWTEAAVDAGRVASGLRPMISSRMLLWACVALIGLSIALSTLIALTGFRAGSPAGGIR